MTLSNVQLLSITVWVEVREDETHLNELKLEMQYLAPTPHADYMYVRLNNADIAP